MKNNQLITGLAKFGLTKEQSSLYLLLLSKGSMTALAIANEQGIFANSVYRATKALIQNGLVVELDVTPKQFQAVPPNVGLVQLAENKIEQLEQLSENLIQQLPTKENPNRLNMELLTGREELFSKFVELAEDSTQEMLVISIGEPVPESIWNITQESLVKGVKPKFIFHKHDKENIMLYKRWQAMGVPVRHLPSEGYHLNIFDHSAAILSASNPQQSKERSGVVIYNEAIIGMLHTYFFQQWNIAKVV
jgi:sugar-specific transcriptional regulator TrmB